MSQDFERSPLQIYCEEVDKKHFDSSYSWQYQNLALTIDRTYVTNLFLKDLEWRANHQQNALISIEGSQSSGKSLFGINVGIRLGLYFNFPFLLDRDLFANPFDLESELRQGQRRRTYQYDEQPQRMVGIGSGSTAISLSDWEDIARYTQKNIIYCSPEVMDHSHYFVFQQVEYDIKRIKNETCLKCKYYADCQSNFYETLCEKGKVNKGIKFNERDSYPVEFSFLLLTKRLSDKLLMPRGIVSLPMITPATAKLYDEVKKKNIYNFENFINKAWDKKVNEITEFIDGYFEKLVQWREWKKSRWLAPQAKAVIEGWFYTKFTTSRFTHDEVKIFIALIKQELSTRCNKINTEQSTFEKLGKV